MNIKIEDYYGRDYTISNIPDDLPWQEMEKEFARVGVMMGYPHSILEELDETK